MTRLILVPCGRELYQVALVVYYAKGRFRVSMRHAEIQPYHEAMATLTRLQRAARARSVAGPMMEAESWH